MRLVTKGLLATLGLGVLSACNDDKAPAPPPSAPPASFTIGGTVSGLNGSVTLANNGGDSPAVSANGAFTFTTPAATGTAYNVTVSAQPANQTCAVTSGTGTIAGSNVSAITVTCTTNTFSVGGSVSGLSGGGLVLRNKGGNDLARDTDGAFSFTNGVAAGAAYAVTIATQPANQTCTLSNATGTIAAANITNVGVDCETFRITGVIGAAGGTLVGPDGVEVTIPAGALSQPTTIGIARSPGGWPLPLVEGATPDGSIYELTPHDVVFNKPVLIRAPAPAGVTDLYALVSSFDQGWQYTDVGIVGDYAELERNVFSWMYLVSACAPPANDPYPCSLPRGHSFATATPANAISMTSGIPQWTGNGFYMQSSAGTWAVNSGLLQTLHITTVFDAAPDCSSSYVQLKRLVPGGNPAAQLISNVPVLPNPQGEGSYTFDIPAADLDDGVHGFAMGYYCTRPGKTERGGADWITFDLSPNPVPGFQVSGTVTGLTGGGLELQNFNREIISVGAGSTQFAFGTPLNAGANYNVHVLTQPTGQTCTIANASGAVAANVSNIAVTCQGGTPPPQSQSLVLVPGSELNEMTVLRRNTDSGRPTEVGTVNTGDYPRSVAVTPDGNFAYVANAAGNTVSSFRISGTTLTPIAGSSPATGNPFALAVDPDGNTLRVANYSSHTVSSFRINTQSGVLTALGSMSVGLYPYAVAVHPGGGFVYVLNEVGSSSNSPSVSAFSVNPSTGVLTSLGQPTAAPVLNPHNLAIAPDGLSLYVAGTTGRVGRMTINSTTGALTTGGATSINSASSAESLAIHPNGAFLYVTASNGSGGFIEVFSISGSGVLTAVSRMATGAGNNYLAITDDGDHLYVTNQLDSMVSSFSIDSTTGALTFLESDSVTIAPEGIALTP